jgi:putative sterol carrier protein
VVDVRDEKSVITAVEAAVKEFGGIDIVINNASAISLTKTPDTEMKRYDLMHQINGRGTFLLSKACIPYLKLGQNPHILNLSPPINLNARWFGNNLAYTMSKYNMSMVALGLSEELRGDGIAANALWPKTAIFTAAMEMLGGGSGIKGQCRRPEIMADAAYAILIRDSLKYTGNFVIDEDILKEEGVTDFDQYAYEPGTELMPDFFLDEGCQNSVHASQYVIAGVTGGSPAAAASSASAGAAPAAASEGAAADGSPVGEIMNSIQSKLTPELVKSINAIFQFDVKNGGQFYIDLKNGAGAVGKGESPDKPNVTLSMAEDVFTKVFTGKMSPTTAYMMGKLKLKGDATKAMALEKLMGKMRSKL